MAITGYTMTINAPVVDAEPLSLPGPFILLSVRSNTGQKWPAGSHIFLRFTGSSGSVFNRTITLNPSVSVGASNLDIGPIAPDYLVVTATNDQGWTDPPSVSVYAVDSGSDTVLNYAVVSDTNTLDVNPHGTFLQSPQVFIDAIGGNSTNAPERTVEVPVNGPKREIGVSLTLLTPGTLTVLSALASGGPDGSGQGSSIAFVSGRDGSGNLVYPNTAQLRFTIDGSGRTPGDISTYEMNIQAHAGAAESAPSPFLVIAPVIVYVGSRPSRRR